MIYAQFAGLLYDPQDTNRAIGRVMHFDVDYLSDIDDLPQLPTLNTGGGSSIWCAETDEDFIMMSDGWKKQL